MELENHRLLNGLQEEDTAVVVGANSSIGRVLISELILKYRSLILTETSEHYPKLKNMVERLKDSCPIQRIESFELDMRDISTIQLFEKYIENRYRIHSMYYLAGINMLVPAIELTSDMWDQILEINLKGFFLMSQCVAKNMIINNGGSIIGIASQHGVIVNANRAAYCASKAGMIHLAKELAYEWAKYGIRVNTISPTMILSEKNKDILEGTHARREYLAKIPLKKYATPQDISKAAIFLNSQNAGMITGENLIIDGGWSII